MKGKITMLLSAALLPALMISAAQKNPLEFDRYHTPQEIGQSLEKLAKIHKQTATLHELTRTYSGSPLYILEIGSETGKSKKEIPAILVAANMEGTLPITSEAALYLADKILNDPTKFKSITWYILPMGNPDAAQGYFRKPLQVNDRNGKPHNDDMDDQIDEDGCEDLNKDGYITQMRVKDPEGEWLPIATESRLMKRADPSKGEKGVYKIYSEGTDNDGDGQYNEDGPGGVNIGINFPHLFKPFTKTGGDWPGSEKESFEIFRFMYTHPEIAMAVTFAENNFCMTPPRGGRRGDVDLTRIKIPAYIASAFGVDPEKTYTMDEIKEHVKDLVPPGMEVTESMIAGFLGLGAVVNPLPADLKYYTKLSEEFKEFLKKNKLDGKRLESPDARDGSFELWAYYHLGLPSFSLDFWTVPEAKKEESNGEELSVEKLEKMSSEEFIALGTEKIGEFMKKAGAPPNFKPEMVIKMVKEGKMDPKRMAEMMKSMPAKPEEGEEGIDPKEKALLHYIDSELKGEGFIPWKNFKHPQLGDVEIGGFAPYCDRIPPAARIKELLDGQVPWVFTLAEKIARVKIVKTEVEPLGGGVYRINAWVENTGYLPYPTAMGSRNGRIPAAIIQLQGGKLHLLEGQARTQVKELPPGKAKKVSWILKADQPAQIRIELSTPNAGKDTHSVKVGG